MVYSACASWYIVEKPEVDDILASLHMPTALAISTIVHYFIYLASTPLVRFGISLGGFERSTTPSTLRQHLSAPWRRHKSCTSVQRVCVCAETHGQHSCMVRHKSRRV